LSIKKEVKLNEYIFIREIYMTKELIKKELCVADAIGCLVVNLAGNVPRFGRVEEITFKKEAHTWHIYGTGGRLLSGIPVHEIGKVRKNGGQVKTAGKSVS
jgi:hypothetical protein